ncbi:MAG: helix-turn-helix domain-containing protein [Desulfurobacteriaceae bacterium]
MKRILGITFYTTKEVAEILGKSEATIKNWIYEGKLGATQVGRDYLIPDGEILEFLKKNANKKDIKF